MATDAPTARGVTMATVNAAKGLERYAVLLAGLDAGMVPISYAETPDQVEEERRLLYVGVPRASACSRSPTRRVASGRRPPP